MTHRQTGLSLIEALITLLILSIGWLGLGQLQARLSISALNQSSAAYAQLIQSTYYEKTVSYDLSDIQETPPSSGRLSTPSSAYEIQISRSTVNALRDTVIRIEWEEIGDTRNEVIPLTLSDYSSPSDTRWLLVSP